MTATLCALALFGQAADEPLPLSSYFGFTGPEVYKLDFRTSNLQIVDVDGDGANDVVVVNPQRNRIDFLMQRGGEAPPAPTAEVNEILSHQRMRLRKVPTTRTIHSLEVADVNSDGRPDLVYTSEPPGLYVEYQNEAGDFADRRTFGLADVTQLNYMVKVADITGDDRPDVALLADRNLYVVPQSEDGTLGEVAKYPCAGTRSDTVMLLQAIDIDGDGRRDCVYVSDDADFPLRTRLQRQSGRLGPERKFKVDPFLGVSSWPLDNVPGSEFLEVSSLSNRLNVYSLRDAPGEAGDRTPVRPAVAFPFGEAARKDTTLAVADFDGDTRPDVAVANAADASLLLLRQSTAGEGVQEAVSYPTMQGTTQVRAVDVDDDPAAELVSLSAKERAIGVADFADGRMSYPTKLPVTGEPLAFEVVPAGDAKAIVYVVRDKVEKDGRERTGYVLRSFRSTGTAGTSADGWQADAGETVLDVDRRPSAMKRIDANGDGDADLLLMFPFKPPALLVGDGSGVFRLAEQAQGETVGPVDAATVIEAAVGDRPSLLAAADASVRVLNLDAAGRWTVRDAINAPDASAKITGLTTIDLPGDDAPELALYDRTSEQVFFLRVRDGIYRPWQKLKVGAIAVRGMETADVNVDGQPDLLLYDDDQLLIAYGGAERRELELVATYESDRRDGKLQDVVPGDLNGDGDPDLLLIDGDEKVFEIVTRLPDGKLARALRWRVFEEKTFRSGRTETNPRDVVIGDVDGDGKSDIVALSHDRVLIYRQDSGIDE